SLTTSTFPAGRAAYWYVSMSGAAASASGGSAPAWRLRPELRSVRRRPPGPSSRIVMLSSRRGWLSASPPLRRRTSPSDGRDLQAQIRDRQAEDHENQRKRWLTAAQVIDGGAERDEGQAERRQRSEPGQDTGGGWADKPDRAEQLCDPDEAAESLRYGRRPLPLFSPAADERLGGHGVVDEMEHEEEGEQGLEYPGDKVPAHRRASIATVTTSPSTTILLPPSRSSVPWHSYLVVRGTLQDAQTGWGFHGWL